MVNHSEEQRLSDTYRDIEMNSAREKVRQFVMTCGSIELIEAFEVIENDKMHALMKQEGEMLGGIYAALDDSELKPEIVEGVKSLIHEQFYSEN
jgi:hypothetical protein